MILYFSFIYGWNQWNRRNHNAIFSIEPNKSIGGTIKPNEQLPLSPSQWEPCRPLVSLVLDSTNYHSWSKSMITTLSAKNKVDFVLGTCPCSPKNHPTYIAWYICNNMVVSWLVHYVRVKQYLSSRGEGWIELIKFSQAQIVFSISEVKRTDWF